MEPIKSYWDMRLVHSVDANVSRDKKIQEIEKRTLRILKDGIKPSKETGMSNYPASYNNYIYFTAGGKSLISGTAWGLYHGFWLRRDFVKEYSHLFKEYSDMLDDPNPERFKRFLQESRIESTNDNYGKRVLRQVIALEPIPVEGLDSLVIGSNYDNLSFLDEVKQICPNHIGLYVVKNHELVKAD